MQVTKTVKDDKLVVTVQQGELRRSYTFPPFEPPKGKQPTLEKGSAMHQHEERECSAAYSKAWQEYIAKGIAEAKARFQKELAEQQ